MTQRSSTTLTMLLLASLAGLTCQAGALSPLPVGNGDYDASNAAVFLENEITLIEVTIDPDTLQYLLDHPWEDIYRRCTVRVANSVIDEVVGDVGFRVRGNTSRAAIKKSWKLSFNKFVPGRKFHGLEKFNLNGEHNDVSIIRSKLAWDLLKEMEVPSSRAHYVHLKINDGSQVEGIQIHVEQVDEEMVQAWFGNKTGNLYKCLYKGERADLRYVWPGTPETYQNLGDGETYQEQNQDLPDYTDLANLIDFINNSDDDNFRETLIDRFSIDNFLRAMAVDIVIGNWDNYWFGANNYYLYHNTDTDRFEYIPYDLDNTYGVDFLGIDWATRPYIGWGDGGYGSSGGELPPLIARVLSVPEYEEQIRRYVLMLIEEPFLLGEQEPSIDAIHALIGPHAFEYSYDNGNMDWGYTTEMFHESFDLPEEYRDWGWGWDHGLKPYISDRIAYLSATVAPPPALPALYLNELMADNLITISDELGEYEDWLELFNGTGGSLDVEGYFLTDDPNFPRKWMVPPLPSLEPDGHLLIWCDNEPGDGPLHATFKLAQLGEDVALYANQQSASVLLDRVTYPPLDPDVSYGRNPDGADNWEMMTYPTPGSSNQTTAVPDPEESLEAATLQARLGGGGDRVEIFLSLPSPGDARLSILDAEGRTAARLFDGSLTAGSHRFAWRGRDATGRRLPSGVYQAVLSTQNEQAGVGLLLVR